VFPGLVGESCSVREWFVQSWLEDMKDNALKERQKIELTRSAKDYGSSYSQTVSLSPAISSQFILEACAAAEDRKNQ